MAAGSEEFKFVHTVSGVGRLHPSDGRWDSIDIDYIYGGLLPTTSHLPYDFTPSKYSKSIHFNLSINDKSQFKRFIYISTSLVLLFITVASLIALFPSKHRCHGSADDLQIALNRAILFFDAQKSGRIESNPAKFQGDSGLQDCVSGHFNANLAGGFHDSGNININSSFPSAYTITLLSWTVLEYHRKYSAINKLEHVNDIIKWGSDYLLKLFHPSNSTFSEPTTVLYSQVGSGDCDLAGGIVAALAAASLVFKEESSYSRELIQASESLFHLARKHGKHETYTANMAYSSTNYYLDEQVWGATWLFFATGNFKYLQHATESFELARKEEGAMDDGVSSCMNNKINAANALVLLARLMYFNDPGYPYEDVLRLSTDMANKLMCSYLSDPHEEFSMTPANSSGSLLQYAATAAFLGKLYNDYLKTIGISVGSCSNGDAGSFKLESLQSFAKSQVNYILGDNPMKISYLVGFGDNFPNQVCRGSASIPSDGDQQHSCGEGRRCRESKDPNPNGAVVGGPDMDEKSLDQRGRPEYIEPTLSGNAGLVAALIALIDVPVAGGIDKDGMFANINFGTL